MGKKKGIMLFVSTMYLLVLYIQVGFGTHSVHRNANDQELADKCTPDLHVHVQTFI